MIQESDPRLRDAAVRADADPFSAKQDGVRRQAVRPMLLAVFALTAILLVGTGQARAAWHEIAQLLSLQGKPEPASANVLSEHEIEVLDQMTPQSQAELLLERSINHYRGANDQIAERVSGWRGKIKLDEKLRPLFTTAINSDDLR